MENKNEKEKFYDELVEEVKEDFKERREERRALENQWNLNVNYLIGNQYCEIAPSGEICESNNYYYWQNKNVYNHIAPIIETRLAKLARVRPSMSVRAAGGEDGDVQAAKIASDVLEATAERVDLNDIIAKATLWSETLGTSFYKITWNAEKGKKLGELEGAAVKEGDVTVTPVSAYEIFPDSLFRQDISDLKSIIHARAVSVDDIESIYGVKVEGEDVNVFSLTPTNALAGRGQTKLAGSTLKNSAIVIERYERPTKEFPNGRVVTVAGDKLLAIGELPYINGVDGTRDFPFVKQDCVAQAGCFFGVSVIERIIPLQRAYNAVKNRKHEFMNRISMGVITVEDGSVDTDELVEEGLEPGKVIVYRQGATPPQMMNPGSVPIDFTYEEERLSNEFITVSGVSEISRNSAIPKNVTSGVALQLLIEQDDTRLTVSAENIRRAVKNIGKHILRLFKQFATETRVMKIAGPGKKSEIFYFDASDLTSDDVVFETDNEISFTPAQRKNAVYELLATGILTERDGTLSERTKAKVLEILGLGALDNVRDITTLQIQKANEENVAFEKGTVDIDEYDDHEVHIAEHTRYLLSGEIFGKNADPVKKNAVTHLKKHKEALATAAIEKTVENRAESASDKTV